ncbi:hypothetical protein MVEN_01153200 [Mycena venus]|uniref:Uncharacterized protein n=1 Tax=Mycena venus TaxID=2733690 RepID=A0A8H6Y3T6_9AGAR|nr:hypothetical protein MVEN_01153200 [Mycena venus]
MPAIVNTVTSLITAVQTVKRNKEECIRFMEDINCSIYGIVQLHLKSETLGILSPGVLHHMAKFTETLHKIHTFMEAQQNGSKIKRFFRQTEMNTLVRHCRGGLQEALEVFKIETMAIVVNDIGEMQEKMQNMHKELLELISTLSNEEASEQSSLIYPRFSDSWNSSSSFSMLPSKPKIFHGREAELNSIVKILNQDLARIVILACIANYNARGSEASQSAMDPPILTTPQSIIA